MTDILRMKMFIEKIFNFFLLCPQWCNRIHSYPLQTMVDQLAVNKSDTVNGLTVDDIFPLGCNCFLLNKSYYGCLGIVS